MPRIVPGILKIVINKNIKCLRRLEIVPPAESIVGNVFVVFVVFKSSVYFFHNIIE